MPNPNEFPPDPLVEIQKIFDRVRERFSQGGPTRFNPWLIVVIGLLLYALSGIYIIAPDERGIVLRFGRVVREAEPGPGYHLPWPFEEVMKPAVTQIRKEEFGFRTVSVGPPARYRDVDPEALMLTGDENIVKLQFIVQFKVKTGATGATEFLFNVRDPEGTVRDAAEAAMREVLGRNAIDNALTEGKEQIQQDAQALLQHILDEYQVGLEVVTLKLQDVDPPDQVSDAFKDVISAQQDKERLINEARGYANDVVPKARGQAAQLINEAEGYSAAKIQDASGAAQRFIALQQEYEKAKDVTRLRLYIETMEQVLPRMNKILLDDVAGKQVVPYLPLDQVIKLKPAEAGKQ
ncbi:MAG: FtsH protease activity modulator HflK [Deltaproteobacteria bacterium]|nr:FtsH protease activity modulator HflK [Deltaproteobacteria bacterium]MBI3387150.1 FtsH protease activity modulator HflK [Deltaproteobacteria bacterium]